MVSAFPLLSANPQLSAIPPFCGKTLKTPKNGIFRQFPLFPPRGGMAEICGKPKGIAFV
jgi:hypothetical protein